MEKSLRARYERWVCSIFFKIIVIKINKNRAPLSNNQIYNWKHQYHIENIEFNEKNTAKWKKYVSKRYLICDKVDSENTEYLFYLYAIHRELERNRNYITSALFGDKYQYIIGNRGGFGTNQPKTTYLTRGNYAFWRIQLLQDLTWKYEIIAQNKIESIFKQLNLSFNISRIMNLKFIVVRGKLLANIIENFENATESEKKRMKVYGKPNILTFVHPRYSSDRIFREIFVDWERPVQHLMELIDMANRWFLST